MGQSQSRPEETPKKDRKKLKAPAEWRNDVDFQVVSPMSDISNPSQFRGRQFNQGTSTVRRNRTSKVFPKQRPPSGLPAPARFYFHGAGGGDDDDDEGARKAKNEPKTWVGAVRTKCTMAKQQLSECIFQKDDGEPLEAIEAEIQQRKAEKKKRLQQQTHDPYIQFDPNAKDQRQRAKSEDPYLQHFVESEDTSGKQTVRKRSSSETNSSIRGRKLSLSSSEKSSEKYASQPTAPKSEPETIDSMQLKRSTKPEVFRKPHEPSKKQAEILRQPSNESLTRRRASIRRSESLDTTDQHRLSVEEKVQRQIDRQTQSRVQRLRQQYQDDLEKLSNSAKKPRDRYAVMGRARSGSVPRRKSVEVEMCEKQDIENVAPKVVVQRRSVSAPRPSLDGSALLHLTGWKTETRESVQEMPALLKIAGWQEGGGQSKREETAGRNAVKKSASVSGSNANTNGDQNASKSSAKISKVNGDANGIRTAAESKAAKEKWQKTNASKSSTQNTGEEQRVKKKSNSVGETKEKEQLVSTKQKTASRYSDPLPLAANNMLANKVDGTQTIATLLQQAYFGDLESQKSGSTKSNGRKMASDYRLVAYPGHALLNEPINSPAPRESPAHLVSNQASHNAEFLFRSDSDNVLIIPSKKHSSSTMIDAAASRHRSNVVPKAAVVIPPPASQSTEMHTERKVRFSSGSFPGIDSKLSDLTDDTRRESAAMSIPRIDSIPEEDEEESVFTKGKENHPKEEEELDAPQVALKEDETNEELSEVDLMTDTDNSPRGDEETPKQAPIMNWSYRHGDNTAKGVTPIIGGNKGLSSHTTNSPYLRFKEAKERFNSAPVLVEQQDDVPAPVSGQARKPPKRSTSMVTSRIAAMEASTSEPNTTMLRKARRATTGREVLAPRRSKLISPAMEYTNMTKESVLNETKEKSPEEPKQLSSVVSYDSDDVFGRLVHPTTLDEDNETSESGSDEESDDDFGNILREDHNVDDTEDDESTIQPSVSTVRARFSMGSATTMGTSGSVSTVLQRRRLLDSMSFHSEGASVISSYSVGDTASLPSALKEENIIPSAVQRATRLPFREETIVKPNELSNGTPLHARKWRALAAAANEKSLSLRNINHQ